MIDLPKPLAESHTQRRLEEFEKVFPELKEDLEKEGYDYAQVIDFILTDSIHQAEQEMLKKVELSFLETLRNSRVDVNEKGRIALFIHEAIASLPTT